jgi:hypothetical protein
MEEKEAKRQPAVPVLKTCGRCAHLGFSFSCVEGYCTRRGKPVEERAPACEDFVPAGS